MLNKEEARRLFEIGKKYYDDITHLIIADDHWDSDYITKYVRRGDSVKEAMNEICSHGSLISIVAVLNYDLPLDEQLKEDYPIHDEPSKRFKTNYEKALEYATEKHKGQYRKGINITKEYIEHPIEVSKLVDKYMRDNHKKETYKTVALLHDTLEDTIATYEEEKELFGKEIADMVLSLTNDEEEVKKQGKNVYLSNKLLNMEENILTIKLCDRLDNIKDLGIANIDFRKKYIQETIYILNNLLINRRLNKEQLDIVNDIYLSIKTIIEESSLNININKKILIYE